MNKPLTVLKAIIKGEMDFTRFMYKPDEGGQ
jgi:hypothetical protein